MPVDCIGSINDGDEMRKTANIFKLLIVILVSISTMSCASEKITNRGFDLDIAATNLAFVKNNLFDEKIRNQCEIDTRLADPEMLEILKNATLDDYYPFARGSAGNNSSVLKQQSTRFSISMKDPNDRKFIGVTVAFEKSKCLIEVGLIVVDHDG